jgi:hypothetical protein
MARQKSRPEPEVFEVSVWNHEGDVVKKLWEATESDISDLEEQYEPPFYTIVIDRRS